MSTLSNWEKFRIMLFKSLLEQMRRPWHTAFAIAVPVLFCSLLVIMRKAVNVDRAPVARYQRIDLRIAWSNTIAELSHRIAVLEANDAK